MKDSGVVSTLETPHRRLKWRTGGRFCLANGENNNQPQEVQNGYENQ